MFTCVDPTDRCDDRQQETYTVCMRSFFVYVQLPILPGSWDKQRSAFKGAARRIKATESRMSGPCANRICYEEIFMCADPTDRCDDCQQKTYTVCMRSFLYMCGFLSFQVPGVSISREHRLKERSDAQTVVSRLLRIGLNKADVC